MQSQVILIIDSRKEISLKYKKVIAQTSNIDAVILLDLDNIDKKIKELEPDLIIISDSINANINELTKKIRLKTVFYRPTIAILSKSDYLNDKLDALNAGADDFLSEPIDMGEFTARIFAHLRRHYEELLNPITNLCLPKVSYKIFNRALNSDEQWSLLYIGISNIEPYSQIYGHIAMENIYKAFSAILATLTDENDYLGHLKDDIFIILTHPHKADKIVQLINNTFDAISHKFYSNEDAQRGYVILSGDEKAGMKVPFVASNIGVISNEHKSFNNYQEAITLANATYRKAKRQIGSSFVFDRPRIATEFVNDEIEDFKKIIIYEKDASLAYLLTTTLEMQGFEVKATASLEDLIKFIDRESIDLIIYDSIDENLDICKTIKLNKNVKLIVSSILHNKEKVLDVGADLYLPKPYDLLSLYNWINKLLS